MKKTLLVLGAVVTVLTLITLLMDLPHKLATTYMSWMSIPPPLRVEALFAHQMPLTVEPMTDDKTRGFMRFLWRSVYVIHNTTNTDVTITDLVNIVPAVRV